MIRLVIFDSDGTLVDSEPLGHRAMAEVLAARGVEVSDHALAEEFRGMELAHELRVLEERHGVTLGDTIVQAYRQRLARLFESHLRPMPGAHVAVRAVVDAGLDRAVASGGPPAKIRQALNVTRLRRAFGAQLFSSYELGTFKPAPDLFLHVARHFGHPPEACLVVEDSAPGIAAARAAGMPHVLVGDAPVDGEVTRLRMLTELPAHLALHGA